MEDEQLASRLLVHFLNSLDGALDPSLHERLAEQRAAPMPQREYYICFTPRSGSSWLTELLRKTMVMGNPGEWFNPNLVAQNLRKGYPCVNLEGYIEYTKRRWSAGGTFGCEMTWFQYDILRAALLVEGIADCVDLQRSKVIYLSREDLVGQALSLYRATSTGKFHANASDTREAPADIFQANDSDIWHWMFHILQQEYRWQTYYSRNGIEPLNVTYEELHADTVSTVSKLCDHVWDNGEIQRAIELQSQHTKLASTADQQFADQFSARNAGKVDYCKEHRGKKDKPTLRHELGLSKEAITPQRR